jgi:hypothetical protein
MMELTFSSATAIRKNPGSNSILFNNPSSFNSRHPEPAYRQAECGEDA